MKRVIKIVSNCFISLIIVGLLFLLVINFFSKDDIFKVGNYSLFNVVGESMEPTIKDGDYIAIDRRSKDRYEVGDIISFVRDDRIITHEIVGISDESVISYITKGINNVNIDEDNVILNEVIGEYKGFRIPLLGYVVRWANTQVGYLVLVIVPLGIVFLMATYELIKEISKKREVK